MKNGKLIKMLSEFPLDMEVCVFDINKNEEEASDEPSNIGVYPEINIYKMMTDEELVELREENPNANNFIALEITT